MATLARYGRRALLAGVAGFAAAMILPAPSKAAGNVAKVGLIDLTLNPETLATMPGVRIKHLSFWATGYRRVSKQSAAHRRDHGEVMARALIEAYRALSPDTGLDVFVASPFIENEDGKKLLDVDQLSFAFDWFAAQGVKIVAMTFVGRNTPTLAQALDHAAQRGLIVLGSAGNGPSQNVVPAYPAAYPSVIAIGTTALNADRNAEDRLLHEIAAKETGAPSSRRGYVDYGVVAPVLTAMHMRRDPEASALQGSSRATVVAAGVLAAVSHGQPVQSVGDALTVLDGLATPCDPDVAARGVLDLNALQTSVRLRQPLKAKERDREAA